MAGKPDSNKAELIAEIAATRAKMIVASDRLRDATDLPRRAKESLRRNRFAWAAAAVAGGFLLSRVARRKKVIYLERDSGDLLGTASKAGLVWTAIKLVGSVSRPFLGEILKTRLQDLATKWTHRHGYPPSEHERHR